MTISPPFWSTAHARQSTGDIMTEGVSPTNTAGWGHLEPVAWRPHGGGVELALPVGDDAIDLEACSPPSIVRRSPRPMFSRDCPWLANRDITCGGRLRRYLPR